eukprot:TRINITY_DN6757_c0_g1_i1.p1 TRINITY_DN6757_c0_g1~~TRINITY_DN6757_c0_g1_i1.p1  ORF type:complete len:680 (-),score=141.56 TRINITY_DN6757_c0_g1_i1:151-2190(-)
MAELEELKIEGKEIYRREGILTQATKDDCLRAGVLAVTETKYGTYITWRKMEPKPPEPQTQFSVGSPPDSSEWAVIARNTNTPKDRVKFRSHSNRSQDSPSVKFSSSLEEKQMDLTAEVADVKSYRLGDDGNAVTLLMRDGTRHNTLIFLDEGPEEFLETFTTVMSVRQSSTDENLYLLTDKKISALDQSLTELNLFDRPNSETVWRAIEEFQQDPVHSSLNMLSKVAERLLFSPTEKEYRPQEEMAELLQGEHVASSTVPGEATGEDGDNWQLVSNRRSLLTSTQDEPRSAAVCQLDWELHVNESGIVEDVPDLLEKIYRGGLEASVRCEAWKYLLGYYQWHHTHQVRATNRQARHEEYHRMKMQWKTISEDQQNRFSGFRERKTQIEKDIGRTDRSHPFYQGDHNPNVALLEEILMTYVMYNFDLGYVQGMSDLLSPLLYVMRNEVDAFWCFVGLMDRVGSNFEFDQGGIKRQLNQLTVILKYIDISFYNYLESKESGNLFFCFRWLLICFKREFNYSDTMQLWEVLWTKKPCKNFHLVMCASLLEFEKTTIMENKYGFNEILKHINDLSLRIDLNKVLCRADAIYRVIRKDPTVPDQVLNILGIVPDSTSNHGETEKVVNGKTCSIPVPTNGNCDRKRRVTDCSNASSSLNNSSSVEVLSEGEETKFEEAMSSNYF